MEKDRLEKNKNLKKISPTNEELIINSNRGIYIFAKIEDKYYLNEEINKFNIENHLIKWDKNPFEYKEKLTCEYNYDIVQVNFKYLAGTIKNYLCLYSMETYEIITNFKINTSYYTDKVIFMLSHDILCVGGNDTITLISIKDFEIILISIIKPNYKISEICVLPNFNIIICMKSDNYSLESNEYLLHYKYCRNIDKFANIVNHNLIKISSELITNKKSNLTMVALNNNNLVTVTEKKFIQIREVII